MPVAPARAPACRSRLSCPPPLLSPPLPLHAARSRSTRSMGPTQDELERDERDERDEETAEEDEEDGVVASPAKRLRVVSVHAAY